MHILAVHMLALASVVSPPLGPGDHTRSLTTDDRTRSYLVHVPPGYDPNTPTPVVLALHGMADNARRMGSFCGLSEKADTAGFIAVYPDGLGLGGLLRTWSAGGLRGRWAQRRPDDVGFIAKLLDDLATVVTVDPKRVYATGMSNGAFMCHRLAAELSDRIAAIASVAGTMAIESCKPARAVPVMHFHGTADRSVPYTGPGDRTPKFVTYRSVEETVRIWREVNGCPAMPAITQLPDKIDDGTTVMQRTYGPGTDGAEVVLLVIKGGGHTWPGREPPSRLLFGKSTKDISANDLIWEFFKKHPMK